MRPVVFHALTANTPRTRYLVGRAAELYGWLVRLYPPHVVDWVTRKVMGLDGLRLAPRA